MDNVDYNLLTRRKRCDIIVHVADVYESEGGRSGKRRKYEIRR